MPGQGNPAVEGERVAEVAEPRRGRQGEQRGEAEGDPTTDPALAKVPTPVGGAKGAGMSLVFEMLASGLVANPIASSYHSGSKIGRAHV